MSIGASADLNGLQMMQAGAAKTNAGSGNANDIAVRAAFEQQMRMTQQLFGEGSGQYGEGSSSDGFGNGYNDPMSNGLFNDAMMMEALSTITRLMQSEAGLPRRVNQQQVDAVAHPKVQHSEIQKGVAAVMGALSAQFESGSAGVSAIGYDRVGGTSYGTYQIASKPGTMDRFLNYLDGAAPEIAARLREAGPADTGSKDGGMPGQWKAIAAENSQFFEKLQHDFISGETYAPARNMILKQTGLDFDNAPPALREVLWSTSVQHGATGAARIFNKVIDRFVGATGEEGFSAKLIEGVYDTRKGQFGSSTERVQQSVANRMDREKELALAMLGQTNLNQIV